MPAGLIRAPWSALVLAGFLAGCPAPDVATPTPVATSITFSITSVTFDAIGATQQVTATVRDQQDEPMDAAVTWASNSASVQVSATGSLATLTAIGNGPAAITATSGALQAGFTAQVTQVPVAPSKLSGDGQTGPVAASLANPLRVRIDDRLGNPIAGHPVSFAVTQGGGTVGLPTVLTASDGTASAQWTLGTVAGAAHQVVVTTGNALSVTFTATALGGPPSQLAISAGQGQSAPVASPVPVPPAVVVRDDFGNLLSGVVVAFTVGSGGGSVSGPAQVSDGTGTAGVGWTLGTAAGPNTLVAAAAGLPPLMFTATATAGPAAQVGVQTGQGQTAPAGGPVPVAPAVLVRDQFGNPVPGVAVQFEVTGGGGSVGSAAFGAPAGLASAVSSTGVTNAAGIATVSWILGALSGPNTLSATVAGFPPIVFTATAVQTPASVVIQAGNGQSAPAGSPVPVSPAVVVRDAASQPVAGVPVSFSVSGGGGSLTGGSAVTDGNGVATLGGWTLGVVPGPNTLVAAVSGLPPVQFTATGTAVPASLAVQAGNNQSVPAGSPVPVPPAVIVRDGGNNAMAGVAVSFLISGGGGSLTGGSAVTNASGIATVGSWTLGAIPGLNTLTATVAGLAPVTISATGTAAIGPPSSVMLQAGNAQSAAPGAAVPIAPSVSVRDAANQPVAGASVSFSITGGTGSLTGASAVTDASGIATVGSWTLGAGANCLTATVAGSGISGNPVSFAATGLPGAGAGYEITVQYLTCVTPTIEAAFASATTRWSQLITGDVADLFIPSIGAGQCGSNAPAIVNRTIDDLLIFATIEPIDGPNGILGSAGWCYYRTASGLPIIGRMRFDIADIATLIANGRLTDVILHEMGHVLGIGTSWNMFGFLQNPSGGGTFDTHHNGVNAIAGFNTIGGGTYTAGAKVPVENMFGGGTINAHWRESVLVNELMTGFLNSGMSNPLSELTVRSLQDFGYVVNAAAADPFFLTLALRLDPTPDVLIELKDDIIIGPQYGIDPDGRIRRVR